MAGPWEDYAPKAKQTAGPWDEYGPASQKTTVEKITDPFRYGAGKALQGGAATLKETDNAGTISNTLGGAGEAVLPKDYVPAHVTLNPKTWGDIPKAIAESSPGLAADVGAGAAGATAGGYLGTLGGPIAPVTVPVGAVLGGAAGSIGSYLARNYGTDVRGAATARSGDPTVQLETEDKARALAAGTIGGLASRFGVAGALGKPASAAGGSVALQTAKALPKAMAIEGGANVAQEASRQALIERQLDPEALGGALVTGAATGGALRAARGLRDQNTANKTADIDPEAGKRFMERVEAERDQSKPIGHTSGDFEAITAAERRLKSDTDTLLSKSEPLKVQLKDLPLETSAALKRVQDDIKAGAKPRPDDWKTLDESLGTSREGNQYLTHLKDQQTFQQVKSMGNFDEAAGTFTGGAAGNAFAQKWLNPFGEKGKMMTAGAGLYAASGGFTLPGLHAMHALASPASALGIPAVQAGLFGALKVGGALTGNARPLRQVSERFSGLPDSGTPSLPSYVSPSAPAPSSPVTGALRLAKLKQELEMTKARQAKAEVEGQIKQAAFTSRMMRNSDPAKTSSSDATANIRAAKLRQELEAKAVDDQLRQAAFTSKLMTNSDPAKTSVSDAAPHIRAARLREQLAAAKDKQGIKGGNTDAASAPTAPAAPVPAAPAFHSIETPWGTKRILVDNVRHKLSSVKGGVFERGQARADILDAAKKLPLSKEGRAYLEKNTMAALKEVFGVNQSNTAKGMMENRLKHLTPSDAQLIRTHLEDHLDPSTGRKFYDTWTME